MKLLSRFVRNYIIYSALLLTLSVPLFYIVVQQLFLHEMEEELNSHKSDFIKAIPVIKNQEDIEVYSQFNDEFSFNRTDTPVLKDSIYTKEVEDTSNGEIALFRILRTGIVFQGENYEVLISEPLFGNKDIIETLVAAQVTLFALLLFGLLVLNRNFSRKIWTPFYDALEKLKTYDIEKESPVELTDSSILEFQQLNQALSLLLERNYEAYRTQKEFTENASHEIQTPLAVCMSKIELLMQTHELSEEQAEIIEQLYDAAKRLSRLNKNLLLLAKIDNHQFPETETIVVQNLVEKFMAQYQDQLEQKSISIKTFFTNSLVLNANPTLLEILITNLLSNAVKYTPAQGTLIITLVGNGIHFTNSGAPLTDEKLIFQRFKRDKKSVAGNGLGLAIVKRICEISGYSITYSYKDGNHHFEVNFN